MEKTNIYFFCKHKVLILVNNNRLSNVIINLTQKKCRILKQQKDENITTVHEKFLDKRRLTVSEEFVADTLPEYGEQLCLVSKPNFGDGENYFW